MSYVSTSALAKELNIKSSDLFQQLQDKGLIKREADQWVLTPLGIEKGGKTKANPKYRDYIVWPKNGTKQNEKTIENGNSAILSATKIAKHFNTSSQKMNLILSELGWMKKDIAGWIVTKQGKRIGGLQKEHHQSGNKFVLWPQSILKNHSLTSVFQEEVENVVDQESNSNFSEEKNNFRDIFPPKYRTKDGHNVRSRGEVMIDNALYIYGIAHAYERKVPIEEDLYCDFFIPSENVYIEYWGMENDPKYLERKKKKLEIYKKYDYNLIELNDDDLANLDDNLPRKLLKYNIKVF
ncbi:hypothetical protein ACXYMT_13105 [Salinimicrobium sp. CAU 1759]